MRRIKGFSLLAVLLLLASLCSAQSVVSAADFNWSGVRVTVGNIATGAGKTLTVDRTQVITNGGYAINPFSTTNGITVSGSTANTFTPSAISGCGDFSSSCIITGTIANLHNPGDVISSGSFGLQSAIDYLVNRGGGVILVDARYLGTTAMITGAAGNATVTIEDRRTGGVVYYGWNGSTYSSVQAIGATAVSNPSEATTGANGSSCNYSSKTELLTIAAAATSDTADTTILPANSIIDAVCYRVTTIIPTAATWTLGDATTAARFATGIVVAAGTSGCSVIASNPANTNAQGPVQVADAAIRLTPNLTPSGATGRVRLVVFYHNCTAPTS